MLDDEFDQIDVASIDIADYIKQLPEPQRSMCHALVIDGYTSSRVAKMFSVTKKTVMRRSRKALAALAIQYGIERVKMHPAPRTSTPSIPPAGRLKSKGTTP